VAETEPISNQQARQDELYTETVDRYGPSLERLARAYEVDPEKRRDLSQDIHFQLWRSFQHYDARCSLRTWIYRVGHHVAASYVIRERRIFSTLVSLEEIETLPIKEQEQSHLAAEQRINLSRLFMLIQRIHHINTRGEAGWESLRLDVITRGRQPSCEEVADRVAGSSG
jgi:RNA polymerase sigma-70 factor, ECF subfamily